MTNSISVLTLDGDDIQGHLKCDEKRMYQILGMARAGKFSDMIMDSFWMTIDVCDDLLRCEDDSVKACYENLGRELEEKEKVERK